MKDIDESRRPAKVMGDDSPARGRGNGAAPDGLVPDGLSDAPAPSPADDIPAWRQWYMVVALTIIMVVAVIDRVAATLVIDLIKADLNLSDTQISLLLGFSFMFFHTLVTFPSGWIVDRLNRKWFIILGASLWSIATFVTGLAQNFWQLFFSRAGVGFSEGGVGPAAFSLIRDGVSRSRQGRAYSIFVMGSILGAALAMVIGGIALNIAQHYSPLILPWIGEIRPWQLVFFIIAIGGIPFILFLLPIVEPKRVPAPVRAEAEGGASVSASTYRDAVLFMMDNWRLYAPLMLVSGLFSMSQAAISIWCAPLVHRSYGIPLPQVGITLGIIMILLAPAGLFVSGSIIDAITRRGNRNGALYVACGCIAIAAVPYVIVALMPNVALFWALFAFLLFFSTGALPALNVIKLQITPSHLAGKIYAIYNLQTALTGLGIGPFVVGAFSDTLFKQYGVHSLAYALALNSAIFFSLTVVSAWWLVREIKDFTPPGADLPQPVKP